MGCLSENTIQELVAGELSGDARAQAHRHIETCAACRTLVAELARDADIEAHVAARATATTELAAPVPSVTATATATKGAAEPVGATLGRYRIEREIGTGAMGVVHAAFDPNLERRIALKVLRGTATFEARDRLLREARAMARLAHPNVVTVYEVSSTEGRDFVAMELIHGETLAEWLRKARRTPAAILDAFLAAGRGLAAAHAAGIVHRDFKPHNVLRSRAGRVVVTDFGLAREAEGQMPALDTTLVGAESRPPSALAGITVTGSLLGTPAYMAPEQWQGGVVTRATDQFAFCVALWEALSGERPYRGPTFDDLKRQVASGPAALDASRIPRRVRGLLRRGLDPDPAKRWPSMDALLERLQRARRRPGVALAITGSALIAAVALAFALRPGAPPSPACEPPARDVAMVWSPTIAAELRAKTSEAHATAIDAAFRDWQGARTAACSASPQVRPAQLQCLDGVLDRFDVVRQAFARVPGSAAEELQANLIDPAICRKSTAAEIPRLALRPKTAVIAAYELLVRSLTDAVPSDREIDMLTQTPGADPCVRVIATLAFDAASRDVERARVLMGDAISAADQCGDERLRADLLIRSVAYQQERPIIGPKGQAALALAKAAASRVMQADLQASLAAQSAIAARLSDQWDELFRLFDIELTGYAARGMHVRQLGIVIERNHARLVRCAPSDLDALEADVRTWRPLAVANHRADLAWRLDVDDALARFWRGDVEASHADLLRLWHARPKAERDRGPRTVEGEVVDVDDRPVAGATVAAAGDLIADIVGIGVPMINGNDALQITTTDAAGRFVLRSVAHVGAVAAQLADRRSLPAAIADRVRLVLEPTRSVRGKVALQGTPPSQVFIDYEPALAAPMRFNLLAPIAPDGTFVLSGVTHRAGQIGVVNRSGGADFVPVPASARSLSGLQLTMASSSRVVDVVVRSTAATRLDGAEVYLISGKHQPRNVAEMFQLRSSSIRNLFAKPVALAATPGSGSDNIRNGDLLAHVEHATPGDMTVCAYSLNGDVTNPAESQSFQKHFLQLELSCKHIGPEASAVVLLVAPPQRFD